MNKPLLKFSNAIQDLKARMNFDGDLPFEQGGEFFKGKAYSRSEDGYVYVLIELRNPTGAPAGDAMNSKYMVECAAGCATAFFDDLDAAIGVFKSHPHPALLRSPGSAAEPSGHYVGMKLLCLSGSYP